MGIKRERIEKFNDEQIAALRMEDPTVLRHRLNHAHRLNQQAMIILKEALQLESIADAEMLPRIAAIAALASSGLDGRGRSTGAV